MSTIKLKEVNAIGATPKEFEVEEHPEIDNKILFKSMNESIHDIRLSYEGEFVLYCAETTSGSFINKDFRLTDLKVGSIVLLHNGVNSNISLGTVVYFEEDLLEIRILGGLEIVKSDNSKTILQTIEIYNPYTLSESFVQLSDIDSSDIEFNDDEWIGISKL